MSEPIIGTGRETSGIPVQWGASQDHAACGGAVTRLDLIAALREVYQWWSLGDLAELADSVLAHLPGAQTAAGGLLSLAADLDRYADETSTEADAHAARGDDDAGCMAAGASGAWRAAADMARSRVRGGQSGHSGPFPVSQPAPDGTEAQSRAEAYMQGVAAERERCAQLAGSVGAGYEKRRPCKCGQRTCRGVLLDSHAPFADLIREQP